MLLAIDIGNTNIVLGLYQDKKLITHWRLLTQAERTADEYGVLISLLQRGVTWIVGLIGLVWYLPLRHAMRKAQAQAAARAAATTVEPAAPPPAESKEPSLEAVS